MHASDGDSGGIDRAETISGGSTAGDTSGTVSLIKELLRVYSRRRERIKKIKEELRSQAAKHAKRALERRGWLDEETGSIANDFGDEWFELRLIGRALARSPDSMRQRLLEALPVSIAGEVRRRMWDFSDLQTMTAVDIQRVLRDVDPKTLAAALADVPQELEELVLRNLSRRARIIVGEEREYLGEPEPEAVDAAQQRVADLIGRLVDAGEIALLDRTHRDNR